MTLHLLKDPISPLALQLLAAQPSAQTAPSVVVLLSSTGIPPSLPAYTVYRVTETAGIQTPGAISYPQLVTMLFEADRVVTW